MKIKIILLCISVAILGGLLSVGFMFPHTETTPPPVVVTPPNIEDIESDITLPPLDNHIQVTNGIYCLTSSTIPLTFTYTYMPSSGAIMDTVPHIFSDSDVLSMTATTVNRLGIHNNVRYTATLDSVEDVVDNSFEKFFEQAFSIEFTSVKCVYNPYTATITFTSGDDTIVFTFVEDFDAYCDTLNQHTTNGICTFPVTPNDETSTTKS